MTYLKANEVAEALRVHVNTVKRISPSELPYIRVSSRGDRRYNETDVADYVRRNTVYERKG